MNKRVDLYTIGWALIGLLLISIFTLNSATSSRTITADPYSYDRGGAAGLIELLQSAGYRVDVDPSIHPNLRQGDLAIAFVSADEGPALPSEPDGEPADKSASAAQDELRNWRDDGGSILWMPVGKVVQDPITTWTIKSFPGGRTFPRQAAFGANLSRDSFQEAQDTVPIGSFDSDVPVAHLLRIREGMALVPASGEMALNYAIGKAENARILLRLVGMLAKPGGHLVFTSATMHGGAPPSFFEAIGPWALSAWKQVLLLLIILAITLGSRFGLPDEERRIEQGSRELVDALGNIYERARAVDTALTATLRRTEAKIAKRLKLSANADLNAHIEQLPQPLVRQLGEVRAMIGMQADPVFAVKAAARLDRETDAFLGAHGRVLRR